MKDISYYPKTISSGLYGTGHCQGIAVDEEKRVIYYAFTTQLIKTDFDGNFIGSVGGLYGHLGCIQFRKSDGLVYGSLEYLNDSIGKAILKSTGRESVEDGFYIAVFDGDKITRADMNAETDGIMTAAFVAPATEDHLGTAPNGKPHIYGCAGIDGTAIGPMPGDCDGKEWLFVAYGVYGDVEREDNDYQILVRYDPDELKAAAKPVVQENMHRSGADLEYKRYFVYTGNTTYGVQNLEYDSGRGQYMLCVYTGQKERFPNYPMFLVDGGISPKPEELRGMNGEKGEVLTLASGNCRDGKTGITGVSYGRGSTGIASLGADENGTAYYYVSYDYYENGLCGTHVRLCRWDENEWLVPVE
ncbi:MAG: hypothetical protein E7638_05645 [Ruminococcaceae bacterium]|nr:hypothetical protein [Oscillospiraceae bacterium]